VGSRRDCTWILGLSGFRVVAIDEVESRLTIRVERRGVRRYVCSGCGRRTGRVRSSQNRTWDDLPWAAHPVTVMYAQRRIVCRACGIRTERIEFAESKARVTRRLRQQIGVDCQSTRRVSVSPRRGHRRVLRSSRPLRRGRIDRHHDQGRPATRTRDAR
jgi:transposase